MIPTNLYVEKFLQNYRFRVAKKYIIGDVMDFGGNEGELKPLVKGKYLVVNYDHSVMEGAHYDTIIALAVIEHIHVKDVYEVFKRFKTILNQNGRIFLTTPTPFAMPVLEILAFLKIVDVENIREHKHYWTRRDIFDLAEKTGFKVVKYRRFQIGFNQLAVLEHK